MAAARGASLETRAKEQGRITTQSEDDVAAGAGTVAPSAAFEVETKAEGQEDRAATARGVASAAVVIMLGNIVSRVLGFARDALTAGLFGSGAQATGYFTALRVQTALYDLLISGVISAAFIPVFSTIRDDREQFRRVGGTILTLTTIVMVGAMAVLELFARDAIAILAPNAGSDVAALGGGAVGVLQGGLPIPDSGLDATTAGITALHLIAPAILFLGLSGVLTALLYARQRVIFPALSPAIFNFCIVVSAVVFHKALGVNALVIGVVSGALAQVLLQLYGLRSILPRVTLALRDPRVRQILRLAAPVFLGLIFTEAQVFIDLRLSNSTAAGPGGLDHLQYATRLIQLPLGIVATAMSLASLPALSRQDGAEYRATLSRGLTFTMLLIVPAVAGCLVLADPLVALAFQRGVFTGTDTAQTAQALRYYAPGLGFAALDQLLVFAFYAKNDTRTPVVVGVVSILCYLVVALTTLHPLAFRGLALGDTAKQISHAVLLYVLLSRWQGAIEGFTLRGGLGKVLLAGTLLGVFWTVMERLAGPHWTTGTGHLLVFVPVAGILGLVFYGLLLSRLGVAEFTLLTNRIGARLSRHS